MPVLKNRTDEINVLKNLYQIPISKKILPMIEIIQDKIKTNSTNDFIDDLNVILNRQKVDHPFLIDLIKTNIPNNTTPVVRDFLTRANRIPGFYLGYLNRLKEIKNAIPVISYNPNSFDIENLKEDTKSLRKSFTRLGFRVTSNTFSHVFKEIMNLISNNDIFILDIDEASHINPALKRMYFEIEVAKKKKAFTSILLNSTKAKDITNVGLEDGEPIFNIDNSLKDTYNTMHHFDGFGDYACIVNQLPSSGGTISPAGIYYSYKYNYFIGYKRNRDLSEFEEYIAPAIIASEYWKEYTKKHHKNCPGCRTIFNIFNKEEEGKSQSKWKEITISHYIYTLFEQLPDV